MSDARDILLRLSELFAEASKLFKALAAGQPSTCVRAIEETIGTVESSSPSKIPEMYGASNDASKGDPEITLNLLKNAGIQVKRTGKLPEGAEGLIMLANVMGKKHRTIEPLLHQIKRAQSSRQRIFMDLSGYTQEAISDITLVSSLANAAGLLPNYRYIKSPSKKLSADAPVSPIAINFFTGQWLELYALNVVRNAEEKYNLYVAPSWGLHVQLPNGDQFELDLVFNLAGRLVWIEAKTTDDFESYIPKYKKISEALCKSVSDAILLWSNYDPANVMLSARGALARMTLCSPAEFPKYVATLFSEATKMVSNPR
jgi:hypothetical protein